MMVVCELIIKAEGDLWIVTEKTRIIGVPPDHCSSWTYHRHIWAEVSLCWGCLWFHETAAIGVGGMGQIYSCLWRTATRWPGNTALMLGAFIARLEVKTNTFQTWVLLLSLLENQARPHELSTGKIQRSFSRSKHFQLEKAPLKSTKCTRGWIFTLNTVNNS